MGVSGTSLSEIECVFGGPRLWLFDGLFWLGWCFSKKYAFPNAINIRVLEHLGAPDAAFYNVFKVSISHRNMVQNVTYTVVLAICRCPKRGHFGKTNVFFLIRFGLDRKSLRCYVYRHFSDFEVSKNAFLFVFLRDVVFERFFEF